MKQDLLYVCSVYIPPQNSPREQRLVCGHFELLQENIYKFSKSGNILCGDPNARLDTLDNYVHEMDGVTFPMTVLTSSIEPHKSRNIHINTYWKALAELCCGNELIILNGRMKGDYIGQFTCHTYNGASVVDYTMVSSEILQSIKHFSVSNTTEFLHHCFLSFALEAEPRLGVDKGETSELLLLPASFVWSDDLKNTHCENFINSNVSGEVNTLLESLNETDSVVSKFTDVIVNVLRNVVKIRNRQTPKKKRKRTIQKQK
ncbi:Hypothetical predicted protein [Paramuricea clavata]|uniref:Uncharacterized protein n=1 Tax=Paramuricea clavata TaxID=317549 RepID=A0A6S7K3U6_PARCT|nr:Hypothetical predicted protein [Paramuricea clavata]